ncbi:hypothetical protein KCP70_23365 [Salmonella enterica subsp. enterica]|nr:hypothetical protein KCP70_23365 [Salmonella enterica subsp. enterica]
MRSAKSAARPGGCFSYRHGDARRWRRKTRAVDFRKPHGKTAGRRRWSALLTALTGRCLMAHVLPAVTPAVSWPARWQKGFMNREIAEAMYHRGAYRRVRTAAPESWKMQAGSSQANRQRFAAPLVRPQHKRNVWFWRIINCVILPVPAPF